jgi:hypothetical protein
MRATFFIGSNWLRIARVHQECKNAFAQTGDLYFQKC